MSEIQKVYDREAKNQEEDKLTYKIMSADNLEKLEEVRTNNRK